MSSPVVVGTPVNRLFSGRQPSREKKVEKPLDKQLNKCYNEYTR